MKLSEDVLTVTAVTWPPLWQYWPAYLAMARTQSRYQGRLSFVFETVDAPITDERLRQRFYEHIANSSQAAVLALCEPGWRELDGSGSVDPGSALRRIQAPSIIRRLPLIWRQPHWVLYRNSPGTTDRLGLSNPSSRLWRFPLGTTSGDFVAQVVDRLVMFQSFKGQPADLSEKLDEEREIIRTGLPNGDVVVTFTPWHRILTGRSTGDDNLPDSSLSIDYILLPGPSRDVTAIQVPESDQDFFVEYLATQIKAVIGDLANTQGEPELIDTYFLDNDNFAAVEIFLRRLEFNRLPWLNRSFLAPALAEYIRLGCYFPYRTIDSAISVEINKRVGEVLIDLSARALTDIQGAMSNFLGGSPEWQALSFNERLHVLERPYTVLGRDLTRLEDPLWRMITHSDHNLMADGFSRLLNDVQVRTDPLSQLFKLSWLLASIPSNCTATSAINDRDHWRNCAKVTEGKVPAGDADKAALCAACVVSGAAVAVVRPAAAELARKLRNLKQGVSFRVVNSPPYRCAVTYSDIQGLVRIFADEQRQFSPNIDPAEVVLYNQPRVDSRTGSGQVTVGIWWRGEIGGRTGTNDTGRRLLAWARAQTSAGRPVQWVGWWRRDDCELVEAEADPGEKTPTPHPPRFDGGRQVNNARDEFVRSGFKFGYVAVFQV